MSIQTPIIRSTPPPDATFVEKDAYTSSLEELFVVRNPVWKQNKNGYTEALHDFLMHVNIKPVWIVYPWANTCVKTVPEQIYYELLTARNKYAITNDEQMAYRNLKTGIIGLSIGSGVVQSLVMSGGPKRQKIADFDTVEITNLNRMRASLLHVGENKTTVAAQNSWLVDPFLEFETWEHGVTADTLERFILEPKLDVFIDEMDSLDLKLRSRSICKEKRIPVLMATNNGDGIIIDIERFDLEPHRPIFHGLVEEMPPEELSNLSYKQWLKIASQIVGADNLTPQMQISLLEIGSSIAGVPQLGTTASIAAAAIAFACRKIAVKSELRSGRYRVGLEELLIPGYNEKDQIEQRQRETELFKQEFAKRHS